MNGRAIVVLVCGAGIVFLLAVIAGFYREARIHKSKSTLIHKYPISKTSAKDLEKKTESVHAA